MYQRLQTRITYNVPIKIKNKMFQNNKIGFKDSRTASINNNSQVKYEINRAYSSNDINTDNDHRN